MEEEKEEEDKEEDGEEEGARSQPPYSTYNLPLIIHAL